jgi:putative DNA primase/helicase
VSENFLTIAARLEGVKKNGAGYMARCPAHDDRTASLSLSEGDGGRILLHCHAGCTLEAITAALGITPADLFADNGDDGKREIVATYDYTDENGKLLYQVARFTPKDFRQRRKVAGEWQWKLGDTRRVLYHLPDVIEAREAGALVYVPEGEKDVDRLHTLGLTATTNPGGAGKWRPEYSESLRGAHVVIIADKDEPGRKHAASVAASLAPLAAAVRVVESAEGKDAFDHLAAGLGLEDFVSIDISAEAPPAQPSESGVLVLSHHCTDTGNAERLIDYYGERVRYCAADSAWYIYNGLRWAIDETLHIEDLAGEALRGIYDEAAAANDLDIRTKLSRWAVTSEAVAKRRAAVEIARSDRRVAIRPSDLDRDGWLLNCTNGTLDLRNGKLRPHDPIDLISKLAPVPYEPKARSELWLRVLAEATGHDEDYLEHMHRFLGACLTADILAEYFAIALGATETTKSTVLGPCRKVMGDYAADVQPETFCTGHRVGSTRDDLLRLRGVRLALIPEADKRRDLDEAMLKRFVSGEDWPIRGIFQRERDLHPVAKVVFHTNEMPQMSDDDDAVWRRALSWPFDHRPEVVDESIKPTLLDMSISGPAILAWLVEGCLAWQKAGGGKVGLGRSTTVDQAKSALRESMNPLKDFFDERLRFEPAWTSNDALRTALSKWAKEYQCKMVSAQALGNQLTKRGCTPERRHQGRGWNGVSLVGADAVEVPLEPRSVTA